MVSPDIVKIPHTLFCLSMMMILTLVGCTSSKPTAMPAQTGTIEPSLTPIRPTATVSETPSPTATITPIPTNTALPVQNVEQNHAIVQKGLADRPLMGRIVLAGMSQIDFGFATSFPVPDPSYIWDLETDTQWELSIEEDHQRINRFAISPDHSLLACWIETADGVTSYLRIVDNQGQILAETAHSYKEWFGMVDWYDDEHLMFDINTYINSVDRQSPGPIAVNNPFTQETVDTISPRALPGVPFYSAGMSSWGKYFYSQMVLSPDHQHVVYLQELFALGLYSYDEQKLVSSLNTNSSDFGPPDWSGDGTFYVVDVDVDTRPYYGFVGEEFYLVNIDGEIERLTFLVNTDEQVEISGFQLSLDGKNIAFNLRTEETDPEFHVALFNLKTKTVTIFENLISFKALRQPPVWLPDSTQFMALINKEEGEGFRTVLVDIDNDFIVELAEDVKPVGWMASE